MTLQSWLHDTTVVDGRVYAKNAIKNSKGLFANLTAGERSDGEASYARTADKAKVLPLSSRQLQLRCSHCRNATLQDP